jgi:site-specific recombinase XerD
VCWPLIVVHKLFYFFSDLISNRNTRRAYAQSLGDFIAWCQKVDVISISHVRSAHIYGFIEHIESCGSRATARQRLAALRCLFSYLATEGVLPTNPIKLSRPPPKARETRPITSADVDLIPV